MTDSVGLGLLPSVCRVWRAAWSSARQLPMRAQLLLNARYVVRRLMKLLCLAAHRAGGGMTRNQLGQMDMYLLAGL